MGGATTKNLLAAVPILASLALASAASASAAVQGYTTGGGGSARVTIVATGGGSFDWGAAGIGAAVAIGVALVLIGGSLVVLADSAGSRSENSRRNPDRAAPPVAFRAGLDGKPSPMTPHETTTRTNKEEA